MSVVDAVGFNAALDRDLGNSLRQALRFYYDGISHGRHDELWLCCYSQGSGYRLGAGTRVKGGRQPITRSRGLAFLCASDTKCTSGRQSAAGARGTRSEEWSL